MGASAGRNHSPDQSPNKFSGSRVSSVRSESASTLTNELTDLNGISTTAAGMALRRCVVKLAAPPSGPFVGRRWVDASFYVWRAQRVESWISKCAEVARQTVFFLRAQTWRPTVNTNSHRIIKKSMVARQSVLAGNESSQKELIIE